VWLAREGARVSLLARRPKRLEETAALAERGHVEACDIREAVPLGRMAQPEDIAGTVVWLLSDDARGVTGQAIDHNNGAFMA
jgi:NAD(P)-dependent dehydrogenase (short-subunit alcohol dehydrogenase family)